MSQEQLKFVGLFTVNADCEEKFLAWVKSCPYSKAVNVTKDEQLYGGAAGGCTGLNGAAAEQTAREKLAKDHTELGSCGQDAVSEGKAGEAQSAQTGIAGASAPESSANEGNGCSVSAPADSTSAQMTDGAQGNEAKAA